MKILIKQRIFIVDDDQYWVALLNQMLNELGFANVIPFANGSDCIDHLQLNPCLVFLDYQMENMDGLQVLKKIKAYYPGIHVVFCTANEDLGVAVSAIKYGSFDYLLKGNVTLKELSTILEFTEASLFLTNKN